MVKSPKILEIFYYSLYYAKSNYRCIYIKQYRCPTRHLSQAGLISIQHPPGTFIFNKRRKKWTYLKNRFFGTRKTHGKNYAGWWLNQPIWKIFVKLDHFPKDRGEHKEYLKPPTSMCHKRNFFWNYSQFPKLQSFGGFDSTNFCGSKNEGLGSGDPRNP